eukprot:403339402
MQTRGTRSKQKNTIQNSLSSNSNTNQQQQQTRSIPRTTLPQSNQASIQQQNQSSSNQVNREASSVESNDRQTGKASKKEPYTLIRVPRPASLNNNPFKSSSSAAVIKQNQQIQIQQQKNQQHKQNQDDQTLKQSSLSIQRNQDNDEMIIRDKNFASYDDVHFQNKLTRKIKEEDNIYEDTKEQDLPNLIQNERNQSKKLGLSRINTNSGGTSTPPQKSNFQVEESKVMSFTEIAGKNKHQFQFSEQIKKEHDVESIIQQDSIEVKTEEQIDVTQSQEMSKPHLLQHASNQRYSVQNPFNWQQQQNTSFIARKSNQSEMSSEQISQFTEEQISQQNITSDIHPYPKRITSTFAPQRQAFNEINNINKKRVSFQNLTAVKNFERDSTIRTKSNTSHNDIKNSSSLKPVLKPANRNSLQSNQGNSTPNFNFLSSSNPHQNKFFQSDNCIVEEEIEQTQQNIQEDQLNQAFLNQSQNLEPNRNINDVEEEKDESSSSNVQILEYEDPILRHPYPNNLNQNGQFEFGQIKQETVNSNGNDQEDLQQKQSSDISLEVDSMLYKLKETIQGTKISQVSQIQVQGVDQAIDGLSQDYYEKENSQSQQQQNNHEEQDHQDIDNVEIHPNQLQNQQQFSHQQESAGLSNKNQISDRQAVESNLNQLEELIATSSKKLMIPKLQSLNQMFKKNQRNYLNKQSNANVVEDGQQILVRSHPRFKVDIQTLLQENQVKQNQKITRPSLSERFTDLDKEYLEDLFVHRKFFTQKDYYIINQGLDIKKKGISLYEIYGPQVYSQSFQTKILHEPLQVEFSTNINDRQKEVKFFEQKVCQKCLTCQDYYMSYKDLQKQRKEYLDLNFKHLVHYNFARPILSGANKFIKNYDNISEQQFKVQLKKGELEYFEEFHDIMILRLDREIVQQAASHEELMRFQSAQDLYDDQRSINIVRGLIEKGFTFREIVNRQKMLLDCFYP